VVVVMGAAAPMRTLIGVRMSGVVARRRVVAMIVRLSCHVAGP
jgi:hypothetical protein